MFQLVQPQHGHGEGWEIYAQDSIICLIVFFKYHYCYWFVSISKESFQFCEDDGATVTDDRTLWSYLNALETPLSDTVCHSFISSCLSNQTFPQTSTFRMYISCTEIEQVPKTAKEVFANPPFLLKFVQILDGDEIKNGGSLHSSSLQGNNPASMTMNQIRKMIRAM